eukprot:COSAG01_NODE_8338_length_2823_cov_2.587739_1_plen_62_part_10
MEIDKAIKKAIEVGSSRYWDRDSEGDPLFCTPVGAVPKKDATETDHTPCRSTTTPMTTLNHG